MSRIAAYDPDYYEANNPYSVGNTELIQEQRRDAEITECTDCGGTLDEYERCSDCTFGHDDCDVQECFDCMERAIGRAEDAWEGER
jgi:hypothetical protein